MSETSRVQSQETATTGGEQREVEGEGEDELTGKRRRRREVSRELNCHLFIVFQWRSD